MQVLSESVASALEYMNRDETIETRRFIRVMDVFFDCLNSKNVIEYRQKCKDTRTPYRTPDDWRFKVSDVVYSLQNNSVLPIQFPYFHSVA